MKKAKNAPTKEQIAEFAGYLAEYQNLLNLRDWRIEHSGKPASKGALAEVNVSPENRLAVWSIGSDWYSQKIDEKSLRETALHEILHIALRPLMDACMSRDAGAIDAIEHSLIVVLEKVITR